MSLLTRYKNHTSSLSLIRLPESKHSKYRHFLSTRIPTLTPIDDQKDDPNKKKEDGDLKVIEVPISDVDVPATTIPTHITSKNHTNLKLPNLPPMPLIGSSKFSQGFIDKCELCCQMCNYDDPESDTNAKEIKAAALEEIRTITENPEDVIHLSEECIEKLTHMIDKHVFRPLANIEKKFLFSDDPVVITEPSMPHIGIIYQILISVIAAFPDKYDFSFFKAVTKQFVRPDLSERQSLASVANKYYENKPKEAEEIAKVIITIFAEYLNKNMLLYALVPALIVFNKIQEKNPDIVLEYYQTHFLPLLGAPHYVTIHQYIMQLIEAVLHEKQNPKLAMPTMKMILQHWPTTCSMKQYRFLPLLTFVLTKISVKNFKQHMKTIFKIYANAACSEHFKVSEASYSIWSKIQLEPLIMDNAKTIFPIVYTPVSKALKEHWSSSVLDVLQAIMSSMDRIDSFVFQELCRSKIPQAENNSNDQIKSWAMIARQANKNNEDLNLAAKLAEIQKTFMKHENRVILKDISKNVLKHATPPPNKNRR